MQRQFEFEDDDCCCNFIVAVGGDCNDSDETINPGADEVAGNGTDDDCDGQVDE